MRLPKAPALAALLMLAAAASSHAQAPPSIDFLKDGRLVITLQPGSSVMPYNDHYMVYWGPQPTPIDPPTPVDPKPVDPKPVDPKPVPVPAWGPLDRILILDESSKRTGRENYYAVPVRDAMSGVVAKDAGGTPLWRCLDKDTPVADSPEWAAVAEMAKKEHGGSTEAVLYAVDAKGRLKSVPLKGLSDAEAVAKIQALGASK